MTHWSLKKYSENLIVYGKIYTWLPLRRDILYLKYSFYLFLRILYMHTLKYEPMYPHFCPPILLIPPNIFPYQLHVFFGGCVVLFLFFEHKIILKVFEVLTDSKS